MISRSCASGLLLALAILGSCGIPPYSRVREQPVSGLQALKLRAAAYDNFSVTREETALGSPATESDVESFASYGLELESTLGEQWTASFALETRRLEGAGPDPDVRSNQMHAGVRRYFGDRALTAFVAAQLIFGLGLEFQGDRRESEDWLGWAAGGGVNLALSEEFSIEVYAMYEGMPNVEVFPWAGGAPVDSHYSASGPVVYFAVGWHF